MRKIFHFNPTCELALANGSPYYQAPALLRQFEEELAPIMLFFASEEDHILKENPLPEAFKYQMGTLGIPTNLVLSKEKSLEIIQDEPVHLNPWGWSPAESNYLSAYSQPNELAHKTRQLADSNLFERKHAVTFCHELMTEHPHDFFPEEEKRPRLIHDLPSIEAYLDQHRQIVLKSPLSSSGRGLQVIRKQLLNESNKRWIKTMLDQHGYLIAEPLFQKRTDLSFQFELKTSGELIYHGISYFETNSNGQYLGHHLNPSSEVRHRYFTEQTLASIANLLAGQLRKSIYHSSYHGFLGIDALIYEVNGKIKMQACLEINPRFNMGILSQFITQRIHPESRGMFQTYYHPKINYKNFVEEQARKNPLEMAAGLLRKGFVSLSAPGHESKFGAYLLLG
ncbi:hypothetical protein [Sunxiuqinia sp. sy24]|uniref:hypothetical protein n=1 Tax=Sunxiuqinia sp. sy24 TaxID=3461495 RepID=UPI0040468149